MRVALVVSVLVALALIAIFIVKAANKAARRRKERIELIQEVDKLRNVFALVNNEVKLQEEAGYSDVTAFRYLFDTHPEVLS